MDFYEIILIAAFTLAIYFHLKGSKTLPFFVYFMIVAFVFELFIEYYYEKLYGDNLIILNFYSRLCIYYYLIAYLDYFKKKHWIRPIKIISIGYVFISFISFFYFFPEDKADILTYNLGMFIVFFFIFMYLYDIVYIREYSNLFIDPYFYFSFGILVFYTSSFPLLGFINLLVENVYSSSYLVLLNFGNIFLSLAYLGVALCSKKQIPSIK